MQQCILDKIKERSEIRSFVETGTLTCGSTSQALELFDKIYTMDIRLNPCVVSLALQAKKLKKKLIALETNVVDSFNSVIMSIDEPIVYWLDCHGVGFTSIYFELMCISHHPHVDKSLIFIDDVRIWDDPVNQSRYKWGNMEMLLASAKRVKVNPQINFMSYYPNEPTRRDILVIE